MKKIIALLLVICTAVAFSACVDDSTVDVLDDVPNLGASQEVSEEESVADPEPSEGQTRMPVVLQTYNVSPNTVVIAGTCEENATVTASITGGNTVSVKANGTLYALEIEVADDINVRLTATAEGKTVSEDRIVNAEVRSNESGNLKFPTVLSDGLVLFSKESLDSLSEDSVRQNAVVDAYINKIKAVTNGLDENTELVFVLSPGKGTVLADKLPEGTEKDKVTIYNQTIEALHDAGVTVIDLAGAFAEAKEYPLFYNTHSEWSEYAAFVAYTEVMNYIAAKFPDAAPQGMDAFDIETVENAIGGDLAYYYGLDCKSFTETVYNFVPKFDLDIGDNYVVFEEPVVEDSSEEISGEESSEESSEEVSEEASSEESSEEEEIVAPENMMLISNVQVYLNEETGDYRLNNAYFTGKAFYPSNSNALVDAALGFCTGREGLPSAMIYRDGLTAPIVTMLAERFNNSFFAASDSFSLSATAGAQYAGTPGNDNVDYIIVFIAEESLVELY